MTCKQTMQTDILSLVTTGREGDVQGVDSISITCHLSLLCKGMSILVKYKKIKDFSNDTM